MRFTNNSSRKLYNTAKMLMPGGVNSPARSWTGVGGEPLFITRGKGSYIWDADGNKYLDYVCSWGPLILGHACSEVVSIVKEVVAHGMSFGAPTELENKLAQMVIDAFPSMDMIRFVNSGTEAAMSALRLARAFTGRPKTIKFEGGYHGHADSLLVAAGSGAATHGIPDSAGITESLARDTLVAEYNKLESVELLLDLNKNDIACVVVEPVGGNMGVVPPNPSFLQGLRELTYKHGALLVFDEVITGFRVAYGGAQELFGVKPDITCLGKIIGGGMPVGAYGGRQEIMETVSPLGPMYQAGTLSGNPVAMAAGIKTLELLQRQGVFDQLENKSARLATGFMNIFQEANVPIRINRIGSMMTLFFTTDEITDWRSAGGASKDSYSKFFHKMLREQVYLPPSGFEAMFVSLAHSDDDIDSTVDAAVQALQ